MIRYAAEVPAGRILGRNGSRGPQAVSLSTEEGVQEIATVPPDPLPRLSRKSTTRTGSRALSAPQRVVAEGLVAGDSVPRPDTNDVVSTNTRGDDPDTLSGAAPAPEIQ